MNRRVLLVEPDYRNKYPPLSLMKLATYHRQLGDDVAFYKGSTVEFIIDETLRMLLERLKHNDPTVDWRARWRELRQYIQNGGDDRLKALKNLSDSPLVKMNLEYYRAYYYRKKFFEEPPFDRICITTLFTFYWKKTVETINFFKRLCREPDQVFVGGIAASTVPEELERETGIRPIVGLLDKGGELDDNDIIIENLPLDYSILDEIDYEYPARDAFYGYSTRGCVNRCTFCVVPKLEPKYKPHVPLLEKISVERDRFGDRSNLLLLDNNVLASPDFDRIIDEIKALGFVKDATCPPQNFYEIALKNLRADWNEPAQIKKIVKLYHKLLDRQSAAVKDFYRRPLEERGLLDARTATKENILAVDEQFNQRFKKFFKKPPKKRIVDFNQGIDARLITDEKMKRLAEIPIRPLRIAFDHWNLRETYEKAVRIAARHGITHLSNYLLYNYLDRPVELYRRLRLNVELCDELGIDIYSFPMKYHPVSDPTYFRNRDYIGRHWNRKFIRAVQSVMNSTKGTLGKGMDFFHAAFGADENEFERILYMPEDMIIYRNRFIDNGLAEEWRAAFEGLTEERSTRLKAIVEANNFSDVDSLTDDAELLSVLRYYVEYQS